MVGTIGFAGSKARTNGRFIRWWLKVGAPHLVASLLGGAALGLLAGSLGDLLLPERTDTVSIGVAMVVVAGVLELSGVRANLVARAKQVPMSWKHAFPASMSAVLYGVTLGAGVASTVYFWSFWVLVGGTFLTAKPFVGLLGGAAYGAGRALPVFLTALALKDDQIGPAVEMWNGQSLAVKFLSLAATLLIGISMTDLA